MVLIASFLIMGLFIQAQDLTQDQSQILQKCVDYPELQQYYYIDNNKPEQLYVFVENDPMVFSNMVEVEKFGNSFAYLTPAELSEFNPNGYLLFKTLNIVGNTADVTFEYNHKFNGKYETVLFSLNLVKENENWKVIN